MKEGWGWEGEEIKDKWEYSEMKNLREWYMKEKRLGSNFGHKT